MNLKSKLLPLASAAALLGAMQTATPSPAEAADFYKGKTIKVVIGLRAGSTYDAYARTLARHMGDHIPGNPSFIAQNVPGAGSLKAYNYIASVAPKDGTEFGTGHRFVPLMPLFELKGARFDGAKLNYVGSINKEVGVCIAWHTSPVQTWEEALEKEMILGTSGGGSQLTNFTSVLISAFDAKFKVISGYGGTRNINLGMERGELQGRCGVSYGSLVNSKPEWLKEKTVNVFLQMGLSKHPDLPDVPNVLDLAKNKLDRQAMELLLAPSEMGRPYFAPPGLPEDRLAILRDAFIKTMSDDGFVADSNKQRLAIDPMTGKEVQDLMARIYRDSSKQVVARAETLTSLSFPKKEKK